MSNVYHTPSLSWALVGPGVSSEQNSCHHHETQSVEREADLNWVISDGFYEAVLSTTCGRGPVMPHFPSAVD